MIAHFPENPVLPMKNFRSVEFDDTAINAHVSMHGQPLVTVTGALLVQASSGRGPRRYCIRIPPSQFLYFRIIRLGNIQV